jgi:hypothetical protein
MIPPDLCRLWQDAAVQPVCVWFLWPAEREGVSSSRSDLLEVRPFSNKNSGLLEYQVPPFGNPTPTYRIRQILSPEP